MRVLFVSHIAELSGGEIALLRLLKALELTQIEPRVVLGANGPLVEALRSEGITVEVLPLSVELKDYRKERVTTPLSVARRAWAVAKYSRELAERARALRADVIHSNSLKSGFYGGLAAIQIRRPLVWHLRDRLSPDYLPKFAIIVVRSAIVILATRVICNSQSTLETLCQQPFRFLENRTRAVSSPLGDPFDTDRVRQHAPISTSPRGERQSLRYVMVGRLAPWKGQAEVLAAFIAADLGSSSLTIVGSAMFGEEAYETHIREIAARSRSSRNITFASFDANITRRLHTFDVLVHASVSPEPFGQVVVEGLAAGLTVVASRSGGPAEIITDGVDGLLHGPNDPSDLQQALERVYRDPSLRERLRESSLQRAQDFAPDKIAREVLEVYQSLIHDEEK